MILVHIAGNPFKSMVQIKSQVHHNQELPIDDHRLYQVHGLRPRMAPDSIQSTFLKALANFETRGGSITRLDMMAQQSNRTAGNTPLVMSHEGQDQGITTEIVRQI